MNKRSTQPLINIDWDFLATRKKEPKRGLNTGPREHAMCSRQRRVDEAPSELDEWGTPRWLFDLLAQEFRFTLDVCATADNTMLRNFISPEQNGLTADWAKRARGGVCWLNPPYNAAALTEWMRKAHFESSRVTTVCLIPAKTGQRFWWDYVIKSEVRFLKSTLKYTRNGVEMAQAPFPSAVVVFGPRVKASVKWWDARVAAGMRRAG